MSYPYLASSITSTTPLRRTSGMLFVIALHLGVLAVINVGTTVKNGLQSPTAVRVLPSVDIPKPPPMPIPTFVLKNIEKATIELPQLPPTVVEQPSERVLSETLTTHQEETHYKEPVPSIIKARVDPSRPLAQPAYPTAARRNGEEGRVELMLYILANGKVGEAKIAQSSGHSRLDESAVREALRSWRFIPQQENGIATPSWQYFAITFRLDN